MVTWKLKTCPRCRGDVFIDRDLDGWYEQCLQCSYRQELKEITDLKGKAAPGEKELVSSGRGRPKK